MCSSCLNFHFCEFEYDSAFWGLCKNFTAFFMGQILDEFYIWFFLESLTFRSVLSWICSHIKKQEKICLHSFERNRSQPFSMLCECNFTAKIDSKSKFQPRIINIKTDFNLTTAIDSSREFHFNTEQNFVIFVHFKFWADLLVKTLHKRTFQDHSTYLPLQFYNQNRKKSIKLMFFGHFLHLSSLSSE